MKISEFVERLQKLQAEHGDLEVWTIHFGSQVLGAAQEHAGPKLEALRVQRPRETMRKFLLPFDNERQIEKKVVRL